MLLAAYGAKEIDTLKRASIISMADIASLFERHKAENYIPFIIEGGWLHGQRSGIMEVLHMHSIPNSCNFPRYVATEDCEPTRSAIDESIKRFLKGVHSSAGDNIGNVLRIYESFISSIPKALMKPHAVIYGSQDQEASLSISTVNEAASARRLHGGAYNRWAKDIVFIGGDGDFVISASFSIPEAMLQAARSCRSVDDIELLVPKRAIERVEMKAVNRLMDFKKSIGVSDRQGITFLRTDKEDAVACLAIGGKVMSIGEAQLDVLTISKAFDEIASMLEPIEAVRATFSATSACIAYGEAQRRQRRG